jgi:putative membrane protein
MYLWFKAIHIIALIAWFAGIFYIWRLFVYHTEATSEEVKSTLAVMERKLYFIIMRPAMYVTLFFGFGMLYLQWNAFASTIWIWLKIFLVILVIGQHHMANYYRKKLLEGVVYRSRKFRILNEVPTLLMMIIVILVVLKPF